MENNSNIQKPVEKDKRKVAAEVYPGQSLCAKQLRCGTWMRGGGLGFRPPGTHRWYLFSPSRLMRNLRGHQVLQAWLLRQYKRSAPVAFLRSDIGIRTENPRRTVDVLYSGEHPVERRAGIDAR